MCYSHIISPSNSAETRRHTEAPGRGPPPKCRANPFIHQPKYAAHILLGSRVASSVEPRPPLPPIPQRPKQPLPPRRAMPPSHVSPLGSDRHLNASFLQDPPQNSHANIMVSTVAKDMATSPELLLERSRAITVQGADKQGRAVVRIVGKYFPARALGGRAEEALKVYLRRRVLPEVGEREFVVVYIHSLVDRGDNFPGVGAIRAAYESLPAAARERLRAVYFVHPGLQARLFFATFGRFLFSSGLYEKLRYMSRLEYLWAHVDKAELEVPECARRHDDELERRPLMDYGIEAADRRCMFDAASMDTSASLHSLRCIS